MSEGRERLFTPGFFVMWAFSFTVFVSLFFLLPTVPYRILALGGSQAEAGMFLGFLTFASALSAPITGGLADRLGKRRLMLTSSLVICGFSVAYGLSPSYRVPLLLAFVHGCFWSALLSASAAHITDVIPESRRAEGIAYWGLASVVATGVAPMIGLWLYHRSWGWLCAVIAGLNLLMALIASRVREVRHPPAPAASWLRRDLVEWRVLAVAVTLFLYSFGYGGVTSFVSLYADANDVRPRGLYLSILGGAILVSRVLFLRVVARLGYKQTFVRGLVLIALGLALLAAGGTLPWLVASALTFGAGFGVAYPLFVTHVMAHVSPTRRVAAFGSILAAFDSGIGGGSIAMGWIAQRFGFGQAFGTAAVLAALSGPYFLFAEKRFLAARTGDSR